MLGQINLSIRYGTMKFMQKGYFMLATDYAHHFSLSFYVFVGMLYVICACCCVRCNNIFVGALTKHIDLLLC